MAWGGEEEQAAERAAGNPNAKNWQDEARKIVEHTMEAYWTNKQVDGKTEIGTQATSVDDNVDLETDFDHLHRTLLTQAQTNENGGWEAELWRYLKDIPDDVSKETDVIDWWGVSVTLAWYLIHSYC
jgi:hypothetical protein